MRCFAAMDHSFIVSGLRRRRRIRASGFSAPRGATRGRAWRCARANDERSELKDHSCFTSDTRFAALPPLIRRALNGPTARKRERAPRLCAEKPKARMRRRRLRLTNNQACCASLSFAGPVAGAKSIKPDPISNSAVKLFSADGTVSQVPGE